MIKKVSVASIILACLVSYPVLAETAADIAVREEVQKEYDRMKGKEEYAKAQKSAHEKALATPVVVNDPDDHSVKQVLDYLQENLRGPSSFEAIKWGDVFLIKLHYAVSLKYRVQNGFGGYDLKESQFWLDMDGNVKHEWPLFIMKRKWH